MQRSLRVCLLTAAATSAIIVHPTIAAAQEQFVGFNIPSQDLAGALQAFGEISHRQIVFDRADLRGKRSAPLVGTFRPREALSRLLNKSGLTVATGKSGVLIVRPARTIGEAAPAAQPVGQQANLPGPQPQAVSDDTNESNDIIVTAQKRRESIQSVPLAVSAFSAKSLDDYKIEGGSELMRAIPNVTFSKTNFASYNFSIRGIGTKALSVTSDPAVAISFNNTPLLRNRLFEQEYFDVERVEVLRGPQGTLYGRNATAGVVNMIPIFANPDRLAGSLKLETGNYGSMRASGMLNVPLTDTLAVRGAGSWTRRDGYDFNTVTDRRVNGRDLWSTRATASWEPDSRFRVTAAWEHFSEDDNRSRTGKQLCHNDPGPGAAGAVDLTNMPLTRGELSQGCSPGSLYDAGAYGVPNGFSLPYVNAAASLINLGYRPGGFTTVPLIDGTRDPYAGIVQSRNLREIATRYDPTFRAKNDVFQLNAEFAVTPTLKFYSQTAYSKDYYNSTQDYNRFNSGAVFQNSDGLNDIFGNPLTTGMAPGGVLNDPQLGPSNAILGVDMVRSNSHQWYQEFRLQSSFAGPVNFSVGANYLYFKIDEDYFVFNNLFTAIARGPLNTGVADCLTAAVPDNCVYVDPNPLNQINGNGHNYFRSHNLATTESLAAFGELYWKLTDTLKVTAGLRYTDDRKTATPVNSQLLLAPGTFGSGFVNNGYPASPDIAQKWGRLTGRFVVDWAPQLGFTDGTLIYASYARGYKGGGANPPGIDANPQYLQFFPQPATFRPESVNAFEIGMKNTFAGGRLTLNANAFLYDYTDYQVSQIVDRMALNENFNAKSWGAELEIAWRPTQRLRFNGNLGYLGTRIADGMKSIDVMNRTQGNADWQIVKPWIQLASSCIAPKAVVNKIVSSPFFNDGNAIAYLSPLCGGSYIGSYTPSSFLPFLFGVYYDPATDAPNQGRGFYADLGGKELPNSPHWTVNLGAQYTIPIDGWALTVRGDYYRQSSSWARVYNTEIDRLKAWDNANLAVTLDRPADGVTFQLYVKNVFNNTPVTDAFINSDDSGLTTNVFTLDPRIFGFSVMKKF
jgi:iron complex outermembrane receptor protein